MYSNNKSYHEYCNANQIKRKKKKEKRKKKKEKPFLLIQQLYLDRY